MVLNRSAHSPQPPGSPPHARLLLARGKQLRDDRRRLIGLGHQP
jgi:hypothetical protein